MNVLLSEIVEESIKLELNISHLYNLFSVIFPEDTYFWEKLSAEEKNHASLIKTGKEVLLSCDEFPDEVLAPTLQEVIETNKKLLSMFKEFKDTPPSRKSAFKMAISLEESAGEIHFQYAMEKHPTSEYLKIFQNLCKDDKDHAQRIREYMNSSGIQ